MTCPICGINKNDKVALEIITKKSGSWEVTVHQGHIVKLARKGREMTIAEALEQFKDNLLTEHEGVLE